MYISVGHSLLMLGGKARVQNSVSDSYMDAIFKSIVYDSHCFVAAPAFLVCMVPSSAVILANG